MFPLFSQDLRRFQHFSYRWRSFTLLFLEKSRISGSTQRRVKIACVIKINDLWNVRLFFHNDHRRKVIFLMAICISKLLLSWRSKLRLYLPLFLHMLLACLEICESFVAVCCNNNLKSWIVRSKNVCYGVADEIGNISYLHTYLHCGFLRST